MTYHDKLDNVLVSLSKSNSILFEPIHKIQSRLSDKIEYNELKLLLNYLVSLNYATCKIDNKSDDSLSEFLSDKYTYKITLQGFLFLEKSSFNNENKILKRKNNWTVAKTIANILNAISIVVIGIIGICVSIQSNEDKKENIILKSQNDSIKTVNKKLEIIIKSSIQKVDSTKTDK